MESSTFEARVKSAQSGDTVVYISPSSTDEDESSSLFRLAFVQSRLMSRESSDQAHAFGARDFLRKALVGRGAKFEVIYNHDGRDYGLISLPDGSNIVELAAANGWIEVRNDASRREEALPYTDLLARLQEAQAYATKNQLGIWNPKPTPIFTTYKLDDPSAFLEKYRNKPLDAIVERVLTGDRLIVRFMIGSEHFQVPCMMAGIRAPATARSDAETGNSRPADPFGNECHQFTESALLQRTVKITPINVSPHGVLIGTIVHAKQGNIAEHLLEVGYARCNDIDSIALGVRNMALLRDVEKQAKKKRVGIFSTAEFAAQQGSGSSSQSAVVYQILSADTIIVRIKDQKKRVSLSSIRQPMPSDPKQSPWTAVAKERLRSLVIGKHVQVSIDGKRPGTDGYEDREMASVTFGGENVALKLVREGYVSVVRHRQDDIDRSPIYDELLEAQDVAKTEKKGMWTESPARNLTIVNYSESAAIANRHVSRLSHSKRLRGMVDYAINGSRFVIHLKEGDTTTSLILVISGIQTPRTGNSKTHEPGEPFSEEAREAVNRRCLQRDVTFSVISADKNGGFIGSLYINNENIAKYLVEQGLAKVHDYSADKAGQGEELRAAQSKAQEARLCLWKDWDPEQEAAEADAREKAHAAAVSARTPSPDTNSGSGRPTVYKDIVVTSIDPETLKFKFQTIGASTVALKSMMNSFDSYHQTTNTALSSQPRAGEFVSAKFSYDNRWYRARVQRVDNDNKKAQVSYIDYGNTETIAWTGLRPLPEAYGVSKLPGQAHDAQFAFVTFPLEKDESFDWLTDSIMGRECKAIVEREVTVTSGKSNSKTFHVTLLPSTDASVTKLKESINAVLVDEGLAAVTPAKKMERWEAAQAPVVSMLRKLQEGARKERRGCWEYGDVSLGDDDA